MASTNDLLVDFMLLSDNLLPRLNKDSTPQEHSIFTTAVRIHAKYEFGSEIIYDDRDYNYTEVVNIVLTLGKLNRHVPVFYYKKSPNRQNALSEYCEAVKYITENYAVESPSDLTFSSIQSFINYNMTEYIHMFDPKIVHMLTKRYIKLIVYEIALARADPAKFENHLRKLNIDRDLAMGLILSYNHNHNNPELQKLISYLQ